MRGDSTASGDEEADASVGGPELESPRPVGRQAEDHTPGAPHDACGHVQEPIAQCLSLDPPIRPRSGSGFSVVVSVTAWR